MDWIVMLGAAVGAFIGALLGDWWSVREIRKMARYLGLEDSQ